MKIIHTADLHIDSKMETHLDPIKAKERKNELLLFFKRLVDYARTNDVKVIIIAGDMFDKERVSIKTRDYILGVIREYQNIDFIYVAGNHDEDVIISEFDDAPSNLYTFNSKWQTISYDDVDISAIVYNEASKTYMYDTLQLDQNKLNIVVLHGPIEGENAINLNLLKDKHIDYLALGHIHKYIKGSLGDNGVYVYPGCLDGRGFDEIGPKGFVELEIVDGKITSNFHKFARRELHMVEVDITNLDNWVDIRKTISLKLNGIPSTDMVKVKLTGKYNIDLIKQTELLLDSLNDEYYFAKVEDDSKLNVNPKDFENDVSLKGEFIRNVLGSNLSEDEKNSIIEYGIKALLKEEI